MKRTKIKTTVLGSPEQINAHTVHTVYVDDLSQKEANILEELINDFLTVPDEVYTKDDMLSFARSVWYNKPLSDKSQGLVYYFDEWKEMIENEKVRQNLMNAFYAGGLYKERFPEVMLNHTEYYSGFCEWEENNNNPDINVPTINLTKK